MASFHEIFGDSDPEKSFEEFYDSDINDSAVTLTVEEDDEEDDISVKSLSSDEEESEESMDKSSSNNDESNNDDVASPAGGNVRWRVQGKVVTWDERKTNSNFPCYSEMPGPTVTSDVDKVKLYFFALMFNLDLCVWIAAETNSYAEQLQWLKGRRDTK